MTQRPPAAERRFTLLLVPDDGAGPVRQWSVRWGSVRLAVLGLGVALCAGAGGALAMVERWRVIGDAGRVVEENLELKSAIGEVEGRLDTLERELGRLRMAGASFDPAPGGGPVEPPSATDPLVRQALSGVDRPLRPGEDGHPADDLPPLHPADLPGRLARLGHRLGALGEAIRALDATLGPLAELAEGGRNLAVLPRRWPVDGVLTSGFGWRRSPFTRQWKFHYGIDVGAPRGAPVTAAADGVVSFADWNDGYGRLVIVDHGDGLRTRYGHNSRIFVADGEPVRAGQVIASVGSTGQSTGPHLHFEVHIDGVPVDPLELLE